MASVVVTDRGESISQASFTERMDDLPLLDSFGIRTRHRPNYKANTSVLTLGIEHNFYLKVMFDLLSSLSFSNWDE